MWAIPDRMKEMVEKKGGQLREGASCAWVPSPTAATLHAMHYHLTDVARVQAAIGAAPPRALLSDILTPPLMGAGEMEGLGGEGVRRELENNVQGILGCVFESYQVSYQVSWSLGRDAIHLNLI